MRYRAFFLHLFISVLCAALVATLVFKLWYPAPYRYLTGGFFLFIMIMGVDLVCGPVLTLLVANPQKTKRHLAVDLCVVALIQISALVYGLYSVFIARPVAEVFEVDRMVVVTASQLDAATLVQAPLGYQTLSLTGNIHLLGVRDARTPQEKLESTMLSLQGVEPSARPDWWIPFVDAQDVVIRTMKPVTNLLTALSAQDQHLLLNSLEKFNLAKNDSYYLPLVGFNNKSGWIRLFDKHGNIRGYAEFDGFQ